jgi:hypothetical protein
VCILYICILPSILKVSEVTGMFNILDIIHCLIFIWNDVSETGLLSKNGMMDNNPEINNCINIPLSRILDRIF